MKNISVCLVFFGVFLMCGFGYAFGDLGDPCSSGEDCNWPLACHNGVCDQNCYKHTECSEGYYCGAGNTCVAAMNPGDSCEDSMVCPECMCDGYVCGGMGDDFFNDRFDNYKFYCKRGPGYECYHNGIEYSDTEWVYLPDLKNVVYCGLYDWSQEGCSPGYVYNIKKYPDVETQMAVWPDLPNDICIPESMASPEFPEVPLALFLVFLCPALIYILVVSKNRS